VLRVESRTELAAGRRTDSSTAYHDEELGAAGPPRSGGVYRGLCLEGFQSGSLAEHPAQREGCRARCRFAPEKVARLASAK